MNHKDWHHPIMVICKRTGKVYTVANTKEALDILLNAWPVAEGKAFLMALQICADVESGHGHALEAQHSFVAAAAEASVPIEMPVVQ